MNKNIYSITLRKNRGRTEISRIKRTWCSCSGPRLSSQHSRGGSQSSSWHKAPSSGFCRHHTCRWYICIHTWKTLIHIKIDKAKKIEKMECEISFAWWTSYENPTVLLVKSSQSFKAFPQIRNNQDVCFYLCPSSVYLKFIHSL